MALDYNEHLLRLAFLLQDALTFIWSGSEQSLVYPALFNKYKLRQSILDRGHLFIEPALLQLSFNFSEVRFRLPLDQHFLEEEGDDEADDLELVLPPRFMYALFPDAGDETKMNDIMLRIRLCLFTSRGVVSPPEKSIGWTMAANLVNSFFAALFEVAGCDTLEQQEELLGALRDPSTTQLTNLCRQQNPGCIVSGRENWMFNSNSSARFSTISTTASPGLTLSTQRFRQMMRDIFVDLKSA